MNTLDTTQLFDDPNKYAREVGLELLVHGYQEYSITANTIEPLPIDKSLSRKQELVKRFFRKEFMKDKSVLDLGSNGGFFDFWAEQNDAAKITSLDIDEKYLKTIESVKSFWGFKNVNTVNANVQDWNEPADVVLAFAIIHWLYSCTSAYGSLDAVINKLASLTNYLLVIEWVAPEDAAIQNFGHIDFNSQIIDQPYSLAAFENALKSQFEKVEILAEVNPTRVVYVAFKKLNEITFFDELPLIAEQEKVFSCHAIGEDENGKIFSCIYSLDDKVLKQTSGAFALHEAEILSKLNSHYFPKIYSTRQFQNYSVIEMEKIVGEPLVKYLDKVAESPASLKMFFSECLNMLALLQSAGIRHRDIIVENIIVRNGLPVLIDFGWAEEFVKPFLTPDGLGNEGRPADGVYCDVYSMGKVFKRLVPKGIDNFNSLIEQMTEPDSSKRITDISTLQSKIQNIQLPENWKSPVEFSIYSWSWAYKPIECEQYLFGQGFYADEAGSRWMSEYGELIIRPLEETTTLNFVLTCHAISHYNNSPLTISLCDGDEVVDQVMFTQDSESKTISLTLPKSSTNTIVIFKSNGYFIPAEIGINDDTRRITVVLSDLLLIPNSIIDEYLSSEENVVEIDDTVDSLQISEPLNFPSAIQKDINIAASVIRQADYLYNSGKLADASELSSKAISFIMNNASLKQLQNSDEYKQVFAHQFTYGLSPKLNEYEEWLTINEMTSEDVQKILQDCTGFEYSPTISILTPVYNVDPQWLIKCVASVLNQFYGNWQLCLVDDGSTNKETLETLKKIERVDSRIKVEYMKKNGGISAATNVALSIASGEFCALLDNDDELTPDALYEIVKLLNKNKEADFIYSDEDKLDIDGKRSDPFFKPDWSPELFRSYSYTCHITVFRKSIMEEVGGFKDKFSGAQDYDISLRISEKTKNIFHIPKILYHWRKIPGSAADIVDAKSWALTAGKIALEEHLKRSNLDATVLKAESAPGCFRVRYNIKGSPLVSILLPTRGQLGGTVEDELLFKCIRSVVSKTDYSNYEIIVGYNNYLDNEIESFLKSWPHKALNYKLKGQFNFAHKINFMAKHAKGEHLVIFNDDLEVISGEWLSALLEFSQQEQIGAVGSKLLYPNGRLQHVGMVLGINGFPAHIFHSANAGYPGYRADANLIRNYSAVTGAAMMVKKDLFNELGGLNEKFRIDYNDTDFCLRLAEKGYRNVYTPYSLFYHHESMVLSSGRLNQSETELFKNRWKSVLENDPYYNPNLTKKRLDYSLDICPL